MGLLTITLRPCRHTPKRERLNMKTLLYSRIAIALALVVTMGCFFTPMFLKWD